VNHKKCTLLIGLSVSNVHLNILGGNITCW